MMDEQTAAFLKGKRVLVTGSTGLIGNAFLHKISSLLGDSRFEISAVATAGLRPWSPRPTAGLVYLLGDLTNRSFLESLQQYEVIAHLAGYASPQKFVNNPAATFKINTEVIAHLLTCLTTGGSLLFASSSEIYTGCSSLMPGEGEVGTTTPEHPRAIYIESKRAAEALIHSYNSISLTRGFNARISTVYGPGTVQNDRRVISDIIRQAITQRKITLRDSGESQRTLLYVEDAVTLLLRILLNGTPGTYNVAGVTKLSIRAIAELVASYCDASLEVPSTPVFLQGAPKDVSISLNKLEAHGITAPVTPPSEGLRKTIDWQRRWLF